MKKLLHTEIDIDTSAVRVWDTLTDPAAYPIWNPFISRLVGSLTPGSRLEVRLEPPGGRPMTFRPTVLAVEPGRELRWMGRLLMPGLFDGEHIFKIHQIDAERVRFVQEEHFSGLLVPLLATSLDKHTRAGFEAMNSALKCRAEACIPTQQSVVANR
jgi:hypothetical protein